MDYEYDDYDVPNTHDHGGHGHGHGHDHGHEEELLLPIQWIIIVGLLLSIICALGILGNILSTIVLIRSDMRTTIKYILLGLTFFDTILLISYFVTFILYAIDPYDGKHSHQNVGWFYFLHTQFIYPICQTAYTGSVYSIILITVERYIAVCWPLLTNRFLTVKATIRSLISLLFFSILLNLPRWFELISYSIQVPHHKRPNHFITVQEQLHHNVDYVKYYHGLTWILVMYVFPFLILGVLNFLVWRKVQEANAKRSQMSSNLAEISITKMLLTVVGVFIGCNSINCLLVIIFVIRGGEHHTYIIGMLVAIPVIINSSVNIIVYVVKGSSFRKQFLKMTQPLWLCCMNCKIKCCCCCRPNTGNNNNNVQNNSVKLTTLTNSSTSSSSQCNSQSNNSNNSTHSTSSFSFKLKSKKNNNVEEVNQNPDIVYVIKTPPPEEVEVEEPIYENTK